MKGGASDGRDTTLPRMVLIDSKPLTRTCLAEVLSDTGVASVMATAGVEEAVNRAAETGEGFVAIVMNLGDEPFDDAALAVAVARIRPVFPNVPVLLLTCHVAPDAVLAALRHGVRGYLTTDHSLDATLEAIRLTCAGWTVYPASAMASLTDIACRTPHDGTAGGPSRSPVFTPRQNDVLNLLVTGMPNKRIAAELFMSESTVKAHIKGMMRRIGAHNRTEVVALLHGVVNGRPAAAN